MNKIKWFVLAILMVSSVLVIWLNSPNKVDQRNEFLKSTFHAVVLELDATGRGDTRYHFEDTTIVLNNIYFNRAMDIQEGDSLVKNRESLILYVYRFDDQGYVLIQENTYAW